MPLHYAEKEVQLNEEIVVLLRVGEPQGLVQER